MSDIFSINRQVFQALLIILLGLLLVEALRDGTVEPHIPLKLVLVFVILTGVVAVITVRPEEPREDEPLGIRDWTLTGVVTIGAWLILWYQLRDNAAIQYPISIIGGLLVGVASLNILMSVETGRRHPTPPGPTSIQVPTKRVLGTRPPGATTQARPGAPVQTPIFASCLACHTLNILPAAPTGTAAPCVRCGATLVPKRPQPKP